MNPAPLSTEPFSPELIRPLPKASPRLIGHKKPPKRKTAILTDTPQKNALAEDQANKKKKKKESETTKRVKGKGKKKGKQTKKQTKNPAKKRVLQDDDSSDDEDEDKNGTASFVVIPSLTLLQEKNGLNAENVKYGSIFNVLKKKKSKISHLENNS